jgi:DNA-binding transcriptional LysR family regulator
MQESVEIGLQIAAITLSENLDYIRAAERLNVTPMELKEQIRQLEELLQLQIFEPKRGSIVVTTTGKVFLDECKRRGARRNRLSH